MSIDLYGFSFPDFAPPDMSADFPADLTTAMGTIRNALGIMEAYPSGVPEGTPAGRVVCIGPGTGGVATLFLAFDNPPVGNEYRRRPVGVTIDKAPKLGQSLRVRILGPAFYEHANTSAQVFQPGGPGDTVPAAPTIFGEPALLRDGDIADVDSQGFLTNDPAQALNDVRVGTFWPRNTLLVRIQLPVG